MTGRRGPAWLLGGVALASLASVALALVTQHVFNMQPCPWCVLQRLIALLVAALALLGWLGHGLRLRVLTLVGAAGAALFALGGAAAALWQHFVAAASDSCAMTLADRWMGATGLDSRFPEVFAAYASCAEAKAWLLGVPYEFYSLALFVGCAAAALLAMRRPRRSDHGLFGA